MARPLWEKYFKYRANTGGQRSFEAIVVQKADRQHLKKMKLKFGEFNYEIMALDFLNWKLENLKLEIEGL